MSYRIKTSKEEITAYWQVIYPTWDLKPNVCWRCHIKKRLDRAHIQALSIDGLDSPENFVLLCKHCHIDAPNVDDAYYMWHWLQRYHQRDIEELAMFQGVNEFDALFNQDFRKLIHGHEVEFYVIYQQEVVHATRHFGQPSLNPSTIAAIIHKTFLKLNIIETHL